MGLSKVCTKCGEAGEFCKDSRTKDGLSSWCKICRSAKYKAWVEANPARALEANRKATTTYRLANLEQTRLASKSYMASRQAQDPATLRARKRASYAKNPAKDRIRVRAYQRSHPEKVRHHNQKRRARLAGAENTLTQQQWSEVLVVYNNSCGYCSRSDVPLTLDHVLPLSKGGSHTKENVVPACQSCNSRKGVSLSWVPVKTSTYTTGSTVTGESSSC